MGERVWGRIASDMYTRFSTGNHRELAVSFFDDPLARASSHCVGHAKTSLSAFVFFPLLGLSMTTVRSPSFTGEPFVADAGSASDNVEVEKMLPKPFAGGDIGCDPFFQIAGRSVPESALLGGDGRSDDPEPLLPGRSFAKSRGKLDGGSTGVDGRQPGCGTPITHIGSGHLSG